MKKIILLALVLTSFIIVLIKYDVSAIAKLFSFFNNSENKKVEVVQKEKVKKTVMKAKDYFASGNIKLKNKNYKGAIVDFTKAISKNPNNIEAYKARALAKDSIKDYVGAKKDYEYALYLESGINDLSNKEKYNQMMTIVNRGNQFFKKQKYHDAIFEYDIAISSYPSYSDPYIRKADTNYILKNYQEAKKDYDNALKINLKEPSLYYKRANTKYMLKEYKSAIEDYEIYSKNKPNQANIYYKLAGAYIFIEDFDNAYINLNKYECLTKTKTINAEDYTKWNAVLDKYTTNEKIRDIKYILKSLEIVRK